MYPPSSLHFLGKLPKCLTHNSHYVFLVWVFAIPILGISWNIILKGYCFPDKVSDKVCRADV